ncbi:hypothetical protein J3B02_001896 [Coemansia erecta]|uniref:Histone-lysine N-methyltransferase n=1 Tax=Coemansia asiatica TaxID=1052880 RepID=A0A9W8CKM6_9FUNG|nr:hypothetical protein LPJ64_001437 [Coemansia asiatica]KAJ2855933.1 hypothetical protein J3B02_001896 [Coemansia erecta]KAJ2877396.1 hypothetical protein FB639_003779 [Coemansia asiatica]
MSKNSARFRKTLGLKDPRAAKRRRLSALSNGNDGTDKNEVEAIVADALLGDVHFFEVKWKGYSLSDTTWTTKNDLKNCERILNEYMRRRKKNTADLSAFYLLLQDARTNIITVANTVDAVGSPENFTYIDENILSEQIPRPCTPLFTCACKDRCRSDCGCVREQYYDNNGLVAVDPSVPLMECGPLCACGDDCVTRVVQKGSDVRFCIFRTRDKGWGVRTRQVIRRGAFVAEYVGEVITFEEAERRAILDAEQGITYIFDLDKSFPAGEVADFSIDAKTHGNVSHFFNHSCDPNMEIRQVFVEHRDPRLHRLAFFAVRDIDPDDELTFDYNPSRGSRSDSSTECRCGALNCRGYI